MRNMINREENMEDNENKEETGRTMEDNMGQHEKHGKKPGIIRKDNENIINKLLIWEIRFNHDHQDQQGG